MTTATLSAPVAVPRVNNRLPTLGCGVAWDASVQKVVQKTDRAGHPGSTSGDPFYVAPPSARGAFADLQLILVAVQDKSTVLAHVDGDCPEAFEGSLAHTGDDKTGLAAGWSEVGTINLGLVPQEVTAIAFFIHCKSGHLLSDVQNAKGGVFLLRDQQVIVGGPVNHANTTCLAAVVRRQGEDFVIQPVNQGFNAGSLAEAMAVLGRF